MFLRKARQFILDILFPIECLGCKKDDIWLCDKCLNKLPINNADLEQIDLKPLYLDGFFVASEWESQLLQDVIHKFKYNFAQELSGPLSKLLIKRIHELIHELKDFVIVPIPLHKKRYIWRGFNQAELLATRVADEFNLELDNKIISRIKNTSPQVKLSGKERGRNIQGAFGISGGHGSKVAWPLVQEARPLYLLIDDVITTGATMNECAKVLKNSRAEKVYGMALARG